MACKHVRTVIKKGLQMYAGVNAQAEQRVATSIAHQVIHFLTRCRHAFYMPVRIDVPGS